MTQLITFHFYVINFVALTSFPLTYLFLSSYDSLMRATLLCLLVNNIIFFIGGMGHIRVTKNKLLLCGVILIVILVGMMNNALSSKTVIDSLNIFLFFFKVFIISELCRTERYYLLVVKFIKVYVVVSILAATMGTAFFYLLPQNSEAYVGLTPVAIPFLISSLLKSSLGGVGFALLLLLLSGKRALLLSGILVIIIHFIRSSKRVSLKYFMPIVVAVFLSPYLLNWSLASGTINKVERTVEAIESVTSVNSVRDNDALFGVLGPRFFEVTSIIEDMEFVDYPFGKGAGYTYDLKVDGIIFDKGHSNAHFSPAGLISKYGLLLFLLISMLFVKALVSRHQDKYLSWFLKLYLVSFLFESLFSYLIFNDKILHFVLALLLIGCRNAFEAKKDHV